MGLKIHLLGPPTLIKEGHVIRPHSAKVVALLAYLVLEADTYHSREKLATLLWGESPDTRARASLRQVYWLLGTSVQKKESVKCKRPKRNIEGVLAT